MEKIFKIDGKLYKKIATEETWIVKIYDYGEQYLIKYADDNRKYHRIILDSKERALECVDHYKESKDNAVVLEKIVVTLSHILLNEQKEIVFKSIEERSNYFNHEDINNLDKDDINLIMRIEEFKLKENQHNDNMEKMKELIMAVRRG